MAGPGPDKMPEYPVAAVCSILQRSPLCTNAMYSSVILYKALVAALHWWKGLNYRCGNSLYRSPNPVTTTANWPNLYTKNLVKSVLNFGQIWSNW